MAQDENKNDVDDAQSYYYDKGAAEAKHGGDSANPSSLTDQPNENERAAAERGYEDQKQAEATAEAQKENE